MNPTESALSLENSSNENADVAAAAADLQSSSIIITSDETAEQLPDELKSLGVTSYNQNSYERGLIDRFEKSIASASSTKTNEPAENSNINIEEKSAKLITDSLIDDDDDEDVEEENNDDSNDKDYVVDPGEQSEAEEEINYEQLEVLDDDVDYFEEAPETCFVPTKKKWSNLEVEIKSRRGPSVKRFIVDDGDEKSYKRRIAEYRLHRAELNLVDADEEYHHINEQFRIPLRIWERLFVYQQESLAWLWGLHVNMCGGIIGDEMGLGKTIQVIAYLAGLKCSTYREVGHLYSSLGPVLLICPATVMHQWVHEFHAWWPLFRVAILHNTGSYSKQDKRDLIRDIYKSSGVLITTYNGVCNYTKELTHYSWHYVVLDEGHKIRNPDAMVTHCCKLLKTPHRLILSGSPIQNNLRELWSLFDFIYPGKLGPLNTFMDTVAHPIRRGGYSTASHLEIRIALKCTLRLRDAIKPYLLRRTKEDVKSTLSLPPKSEQVLFCKLSDLQRDLYEKYIDSGVIRSIHQGKTQVFAALVKIRKICNHPYLFDAFTRETPTFDDEFFLESGKMQVVSALLKLWHKQKHKVLLFTQSRQMLDLLERFVQMKEYDYLRMDGQTSIGSRQSLIKEFNTDPDRFLFLLTTKVGGLGINLVGADRVIIYDPDWNPCTDIQARERCWRIGQNKDVIIYRLLTAGSVEEKIYHRQIFKQYLVNSVLKNPHHRRFFKVNNLRELFVLNTFNQTSLMFSDSKVKLKTRDKSKSNAKRKANHEEGDQLPKIQKKKLRKESSSSSTDVEITESRRQELRERAKELSRQIALKFAQPSTSGQQSEPVDKCSPNTSDNTTANNTNELQTETPLNLPKKKEKPPKEGIKFEGKRIKGLVSQETFEEVEKQASTKKKKHSRDRGESSKGNNKEDYILSNLLGNSLDVVLQHDSIENVNIPDHYHIEREAEKVAQEAIEGLRNSDSRPINPSITYLNPIRPILMSPTKSSTGSSDLNRPSSSNLIAALKARQQQNDTVQSKSSPSLSSSSLSSPAVQSNTRFLENTDLIAQLRDFVRYKAARPNQATSDEILEHFEGRLAPEKCSIFKSMLRSLCDKICENGQIFWRLKTEFVN